MHKLALTLAALTVPAAAQAATIKNLDKGVAIVTVQKSGGKKEFVKLMPGASYDSKDQDATFSVGNTSPVSAKKTDQLELSGGKIVPVPDKNTPPAK